MSDYQNEWAMFYADRKNNKPMASTVSLTCKTKYIGRVHLEKIWAKLDEARRADAKIECSNLQNQEAT